MKGDWQGEGSDKGERESVRERNKENGVAYGVLNSDVLVYLFLNLIPLMQRDLYKRDIWKVKTVYRINDV